jgi:hypothetical protein
MNYEKMEIMELLKNCEEILNLELEIINKDDNILDNCYFDGCYYKYYDDDDTYPNYNIAFCLTNIADDNNEIIAYHVTDNKIDGLSFYMIEVE